MNIYYFNKYKEELIYNNFLLILSGLNLLIVFVRTY